MHGVKGGSEMNVAEYWQVIPKLVKIANFVTIFLD